MIFFRRIEGLSMAPTYWHGQVVVGKHGKKPKVGDVVVVKHHKVEHIKRVHKLDDGKAYLLGDNPEESTDSREYGWVSLENVVGTIFGGYKESTAEE